MAVENSGSKAKLGSSDRPLRVAIIGSGPSGFYAAEALLKQDGLAVSVDMFDRLPTPYGLVRFGVAPDHQKIKSVIKAYERVISKNADRLRFFGNVMLGRDIQLEDLRRHYDQIVYAVGCETDRRMGIEGEDLAGSYTATAFVAWFNGHPDFVDHSFDLSHERVVVVGVGNVAIDVARVLLRDNDELATTDIAEHALEALRKSKVREVVMIGRRGVAQAAFSPKEIKEIGELNGVEIAIDPAELELDELSQAHMEQSGDSRKIVEYLRSLDPPSADSRICRLRFLTSPVELIGKDGSVTAVRACKNELYQADNGRIRPRHTDQTDLIEVGSVFRSIGYHGIPLPGVPFHERWGTIPNKEGRVTTYKTEELVPNEYVVGWIKRGPTGLVGTNRADAKETVEQMLVDATDQMATVAAEKTPQAVDRLLAERNLRTVSFADWKVLDALELENGKKRGKVREKFVRLEEMFAALSNR